MKLQPGTLIGPFQIREPLGAGGMGEVYRARDPRLQRDVALKILSPDLARDSEAMARFDREARAVAALSHPNILAIHDIGDHEGTPYLVTELLQGETLRNRLRRAPITWTEAAEIGSATAAAVAAAHAHHIVHRDIKPENIFLVADGQVKILDFGLAAARSKKSIETSTGSATITQAGTILGTVGYMSPEQVRGERAEASSDLFSVGCVMYEMVANRQPFSAETAIQSLNAILVDNPPPLSECGYPAPPEFEQLIFRCLEKSPALRLQSAHDLSVALRELPGRAPANVPDSRPRIRILAFVSAVLLVALIVMLAMGPFRRQNADSIEHDSIRSLAVLPLENLSGDVTQDYFADGMTDALITSLGRTGELRVIARAAVMKYKGQSASLSEIGRALGVQAILTGTVLRSDDRVQVTVQLIDPASDRVMWSDNFSGSLADILTLQSDLTRAVATQASALDLARQTRSQANRAVDPKAYESYLRARYLLGSATTDEKNQEAIDLLDEAIDRDPRFAPAHAAKARAYISRRTDIAPHEAGMLESTAYASIMQALSLDSQLAEAYLAFGDLLWTPSYKFAHAR
ncbi:MAG: serine/threonine protein kinase, partial [Pirellulaceae bacterium]